jgi:exodeoxyribonuclease VII large subunit
MTTDLFGETARIVTVGELTRAIRGTLETKFGAVWVQGEVSNYKSHPSGHQYFTLKDARAQIACVIFRNTLPRNAPPLTDGAQVQIYGNVTVFEARGQYQLSVQIVQARGAGLLQAKFEALKQKLDAEGLFDPARKRPLPKFPRRIGIVTSPSGAAIRDMLNVLQRRAPNVHILINPVRVQGTGAATEIAVAIRELNEPTDSWPPLDLIVITRGGGSIEDLWEFNEEIVARAIFHSRIPVVSAVGHEVDFTIADFVADLRAPTPSAAAELIVPDFAAIGGRVDELATCLDRYARNFVAQSLARLRMLSDRTLTRELMTRMREAQQTLDIAAESLRRQIDQRLGNARLALANRAQIVKSSNPARELVACRAKLADLTRRFISAPPSILAQAKQRFERTDAVLRVLGPEATLRRGYTITMDVRRRVIYSTANIPAGMRLRTRLSDGEIESSVIPR